MASPEASSTRGRVLTAIGQLSLRCAISNDIGEQGRVFAWQRGVEVVDLLARHVVVQSGEHGARVRFSFLAVDVFELGDAGEKLLSDGCISRPIPAALSTG